MPLRFRYHCSFYSANVGWSIILALRKKLESLPASVVEVVKGANLLSITADESGKKVTGVIYENLVWHFIGFHRCAERLIVRLGHWRTRFGSSRGCYPLHR